MLQYTTCVDHIKVAYICTGCLTNTTL